ncbi:hypothetical protein [Eubacterium sp. 1001713B170207_170306_E7]|uniref:hypothetical protein n=1 Tax=Eubacterium sp. 1001713B170207_170306_E7 TaxID=2787097 RepID=UPI00189A7D35|nr:hypothetical protein [Eubacterium sp. 1001713B170207_170306_E7]
MGLNYMTELNAMRDYLLLRPLASGRISLWHGLMMVNNLCVCGWKSWFTAPNMTLRAFSGLSDNGILGARRVLKERGLIDFVPGASGEIPAKYHMHPVSGRVREVRGTAGSSGGGSAAGSSGSSAAFYKQNKPDKKRQKETTNPFLKMLNNEEEM